MTSTATARRRLQAMMQHDRSCSYCGLECIPWVGARVAPYTAWRLPTLDHDIPKARGGTRNGPNGVLSCMGCNTVKGDMTGEEYRHFRQTGELHPDYIRWTTERTIRMAKARGIHIGPQAPKAETVPIAPLDYEDRKAAAEFELKLVNGMIDSIGEMTQKMLAKKR